MKTPYSTLLWFSLASALGATAQGKWTDKSPSQGVISSRIQRVEGGLLPAIVIDGSPETHFTLAERMRFYKTPGLSIAVIHRGKIEWARGYGVCEAGATSPVTAQTVFQAASISKPLAALVALRLVEQGKLMLDEDVNRKLVSWKVPENEFTPEKKVTLRWLLCHRAGLTDNAGFLPVPPGEPWPALREVLEGSRRLTPAPIRVGYEPGSLRFQYSGGGYCLIEQLLEDVSGKSFPKLARELVLGPLQMTSSSFEQPISPDLLRRAAVGHRSDGKPMPQKWNAYAATTAAGLWTTPTDLARFVIEVQNAQAHHARKIFSPRMANQMLTRQGMAWGLGVGLVGDPPARFYHTGSNPGYQSELEAYIDQGEGAVVMANADQGWRLVREVLWSIAREYHWPGYPYAPEARKSVRVAPEVLAKYVGSYRLDSSATTNLVIQITCEGARLFAKNSAEQTTVELHPESDDRFFVIEDAITLTFTRDDSGNIRELVSDQKWRAKREQR